MNKTFFFVTFISHIRSGSMEACLVFGMEKTGFNFSWAILFALLVCLGQLSHDWYQYQLLGTKPAKKGLFILLHYIEIKNKGWHYHPLVHIVKRYFSDQYLSENTM